ncbi:hypothetical protein FF098_013070 [Parvularcula flava]|nr:hypothetical protein [Aquisalinus luteolus]NHK28846.1 hypothetical protein [Aquisalinus luteolus]
MIKIILLTVAGIAATISAGLPAMAQDSCMAGDVVGNGWSLRVLSVNDDGKASFNLSTGLPDSMVKENGLKLTDAEKADSDYTGLSFNGRYEPGQGTSWSGFVFAYGDVEGADGTPVSSSDLIAKLYVGREYHGEGSVYNMGAGMQGFFQGDKYPAGLAEGFIEEGVQIDFFMCKKDSSECLSTSVRLTTPSNALTEAGDIMKARSEKKVATGSCS